MSKLKIVAQSLWAHVTAIVDWWGAMSGAISIPLTVLAAVNQWPQRQSFAILAFVALWIMVISLVRKNMALLRREAPAMKLDIAGVTDTEAREQLRITEAQIRALSPVAEPLVSATASAKIWLRSDAASHKRHEA